MPLGASFFNIMNIIEFVNSVGDVSAYKDETITKKNKVIVQATRHCTRSDMTELYEISRPNEEKVFNAWRNSNKRNITVSAILKFKMLLVRVLQSSLKEFDVDIKNFFTFVYDDLILLSLYDPNAIIVIWPYNPDKEKLPLVVPVEEGGFAQNLELGVKIQVLNYDKIVNKTDEFVIFYAGTIKIKDDDYKYYYGIDKDNYYIILPELTEKKELIYKTSIWYSHNLQYLPIAEIPGFKTQENYKESVAWGAYEYLDEVVISFSSDQVNRIRHVQPKLVVNADLVCTTCNGSRQETLISNETITCRTCKGTGTLSEVGEFTTINIRGRNEFDRANSNPIYYVNTPGNIEYTFSIWEKLLDKADKQLCTDLLEGTGNESGIAKELRLEPRQDLLKMYGEQFCTMINDIVNSYNAIKNNGKDKINLVPPEYYSSQTPEMVEYQIANSPISERQIKYLELIKIKYRGDEIRKYIHSLALVYAPLFLYKTDEIDVVINNGAYNEQDIIRRDFALYVLSELITSEKDMKTPLKILFDKADQKLRDLGKLPVPIDENIGIGLTRSKLLDTVGGADAAIKINQAVADKVMSEAAAEKLLSKFFQISIDEAKDLIQVPDNSNLVSN